jgi:hypothetical protein
VKRVWTGVGLVAALSVGLEILYRHDTHPLYWWHRLPAFDLLFGFLGCVAIVVVSKALGKAGLRRPERKDEP